MMLTPRQVCADRLGADARNIDDLEHRIAVGQRVRSESLAYLVADCASSWRMACRVGMVGAGQDGRGDDATKGDASGRGSVAARDRRQDSGAVMPYVGRNMDRKRNARRRQLSGAHTAASWNAAYPIGTAVRYWPIYPPVDDVPPVDTMRVAVS